MSDTGYLVRDAFVTALAIAMLFIAKKSVSIFEASVMAAVLGPAALVALAMLLLDATGAKGSDESPVLRRDADATEFGGVVSKPMLPEVAGADDELYSASFLPPSSAAEAETPVDPTEAADDDD